MKKISKIGALLLLLGGGLFVLTGCGSNETIDTSASTSQTNYINSITNITNNNVSTNQSRYITINDILNKFKENGIEVILEETKPYYSMIGAIDGEIFYYNNQPVKLYLFENEQAYNTALEQFSILKDIPKKDLIVLDTLSEEIKAIFNSL